MIKKKITRILQEIQKVLELVDDEHVDLALKEIITAKKIVLCGAGRMGMVAKAFATRLGHLGLSTYTIGDSTVPKIGKKDLLIVCSGSGETQTIFDIALSAKQHRARILLFSSYIDHNKSRIAKIADKVVVINAPSKIKQLQGFTSVQPMTTLYEQSLFIFFDALVLLLMEKLHKTEKDLWDRHSILE